jgi:hypothetical protein
MWNTRDNAVSLPEIIFTAYPPVSKLYIIAIIALGATFLDSHALNEIFQKRFSATLFFNSQNMLMLSHY